MTTYHVPKCSIRPDIMHRLHYFVGGEEVTEAEFNKARAREERECRKKHVPQRGRRFREPALHGDRQDFRREKDPITGRDGRYFPQLARFSGDPSAVMQTVSHGAEIAKRRGYGIERWA